MRGVFQELGVYCNGGRVITVLGRNWVRTERGGLAVEDEEPKLELDYESLLVQGSSNLQQWGIDPTNQIPT